MSQIVYGIILCICFLSILLHELHVLTLRISCAERHSCTVSVIHPACRKLHGKVWSFDSIKRKFERDWYPIPLGVLGPVITPQPVACGTKLIKPNLKDVSSDNVHTSHSNNLDKIMHHYYQHYIFHVKYILSQQPLCYSMDLLDC